MINTLTVFFKTMRIFKIFSWASANDRLTILALAIMSALIWYLAEPIIFTYDSYAYLNSARAILGLENSSYVYFRAPFLPLLLAATRVPTTQSFSWFICIQFILGVFSVIILHACLRRISQKFGLLMILLYISAFVSFVHAKSVMTEEIYLFGWCLCIDGVLSYLSKPTLLRLSQITVALLILAMTRAQGAFVMFIVLPFLMLALPKRSVQIIVAGIILLLSTFTYSHFNATKAHLIEDQMANASASELGITNTTGKMLFVIVYWDPFRRMNWTLVHPENGPATKRLFLTLKEYYSTSSNS